MPYAVALMPDADEYTDACMQNSVCMFASPETSTAGMVDMTDCSCDAAEVLVQHVVLLHLTLVM